MSVDEAYAPGLRDYFHLKTPARALTRALRKSKFAVTRAQLMLSLFTDFENFSAFKPHPSHDKEVDTMLDQVIAWGGALKIVRSE